MIKRSNKKKNKYVYIIWSILLIVVFFFFIESKIETTVAPVAENKSKEISTNFINESVYRILSENSVDYSQLVKIKYDNLGQITSVETNTTEINKIQATVSQEINDDFSKLQNENIPINLGTISGISFFIGKGPIVNFRVIPSGYVKIQLASEFKEAGINQTIHQMKLNVSADANLILPGRHQPFEVQNTYILTDTVIVGKIPEGYTYIAGDTRDNISKYNDYKTTTD